MLLADGIALIVGAASQRPSVAVRKLKSIHRAGHCTALGLKIRAGKRPSAARGSQTTGLLHGDLHGVPARIGPTRYRRVERSV